MPIQEGMFYLLIIRFSRMRNLYRSLKLAFLCGLLGLLYQAILPQSSHAFDTGHHFDQTRAVLKSENFSPDSLEAVQLANWLTDYYSSAPSSNSSLRPSLEKLNFDDLENENEVRRDFNWLMHNTRALVKEAANKEDRVMLLAVMGMAHHAIQDLYSHSNWTSLFPRHADNSFNTTLFHEVYRPIIIRTGIFPGTGKDAHGDNYSGLNQDSITRPKWMEAHVFAFMATRWLNFQLKQWVEETRPGFWQRTAGLHVSRRHRKDIARDMQSSRDISMWVKATLFGMLEIDGKWKGNKSGHRQKFLAAIARITNHKRSYIRAYILETHIAQRLAKNFNTDSDAPPTAFITPPPSNLKAVVVTINLTGTLPDKLRNKRIYADMKIADTWYQGREYKVSAQREDPQIPYWREIHFIDKDEQKIPVELSIFEGFRKEHNSNPKITPEILSREILIETIQLREN